MENGVVAPLATFPLSGSGIVALNQPSALVVTVTQFPQGVETGSANPPNYFHVALLVPGTNNGWFASVPVSQNPFVLPLQPGCTQLGFSCFRGATLSVTEVASTSSLPIFQRNPLFVKKSSYQFFSTGTPDTPMLPDYVVPAGRVFQLSHVRLFWDKLSMGTFGSAWLKWAGYDADILFFVHATFAIGPYETTIPGANSVFPAGRHIGAVANFSGDAQGEWLAGFEFTGTEFDA